MKVSTFLFQLLWVITLLALGCQSNERQASTPSPPAQHESSPKAAPSGNKLDRIANIEADEAPHQQQGQTPETEAMFNAIFSSVAASNKFPDSSKHFIRTASLRFLTTNVLTTTIAIENIAIANSGFVIKNHLEHALQRQWTTPISADSALDTRVSIVTNTLTVRVPWQSLDTTLRMIGKWSEVLDYRRIDAQDITLDQLENELERLRNLNFEAQLNDDITQHGKQLGTVGETRERSLRGRAVADQARIQNLKIADAVRYSTIEIEIYQGETIQTKVLPREKVLIAYSPGVLSRLGEAFLNGWQMLANIFIGMIYIWPLFLILFVVYMGYRSRVLKLPITRL